MRTKLTLNGEEVLLKVGERQEKLELQRTISDQMPSREKRSPTLPAHFEDCPVSPLRPAHVMFLHAIDLQVRVRVVISRLFAAA